MNRPVVTDPLAEVVSLLQPQAALSKVVSGGGAWRVRRPPGDRPFYCVVLEGAVRLQVQGREAVELAPDDFVLIPALSGFVLSGGEPAADDGPDPDAATVRDGEVRHGDPDAPSNLRALVGHLSFGAPDAALLVSLLPQLVHVRGDPRLGAIVRLVGEEARHQRPAREIVLARLLEVMLIEALRSSSGTAASPGLLRCLADARLAAAVRRLHEQPARHWTVASMANEAALSRSAFYERFNRAMGVAPMEYLLSWRMALAKNFLRQGREGLAAIAERVGYGSANAFSAAFTRFVGAAPTHYLRALGAPRDSGAPPTEAPRRSSALAAARPPIPPLDI